MNHTSDIIPEIESIQSPPLSDNQITSTIRILAGSGQIEHYKFDFWSKHAKIALTFFVFGSFFGFLITIIIFTFMIEGV